MTEPTPIVIPRENVNDESATLVAWSVPEGERVAAGQPVAQVETSKAVVDLPAPVGGVLRRQARAGEDVPIGAVLGWIVAVGAESPPIPPPRPEASPAARSNPDRGRTGATNGSAALPLAPSVRRIVAEEKIDPARVQGTGRGGRLTKADILAHFAPASTVGHPGPRATRFSQKARALIRQLGLNEHAFEGRGLVRSRDVLPASPAVQAAAEPTSSAPPARPSPVAASGVKTRSERLPRAKRTEARYLRSGFEMTLPSVVAVTCPTRGFREAAGRRSSIAGNATAIIVFEAARLLRKYPAFNAYHDAGAVHYYEDVNVGFAVDAGRGLKVPVLREADAKSITEIASEMRDLVVTYLDDALAVESLAGGTFTVTDLSGEGVTAFHPLINQGQSAILGICAEVFPPGTRSGTFNLVLAFDHQLAEGRTAARFLCELRDRLASHESAIVRGGEEVVEEPRCSRCLAGFHELAANGHCLVQTVRADGSIRLLCKLCFQGWT